MQTVSSTIDYICLTLIVLKLWGVCTWSYSLYIGQCTILVVTVLLLQYVFYNIMSTVYVFYLII